MSAIAGLWHFDQALDPQRLDRMLTGLARYGAGRPRAWHADRIAIGRWLIPTVPEDVFDRQPLAGSEGRLHLVADLRLDNRSDLLDQLGLSAAVGAQMADAELLMRAWERWGTGCLDRLVGDYAVAAWDEAEGKLFLARDPMGFRPLVYHEGDGFFAFASMPAGLHALPEVPYAVDEARVRDSVLLMIGQQERSFFLNIGCVRPGELVIVQPDRLERRQHWRPEAIKPLRLGKPADYAEALRDAFERAVASQLRGSGTVASQLSGGLDSTCVTATAARLLEAQGRDLIALTAAPRIGYSAPDMAGRLGDESGLAAALAALHRNIEHVIIRPGDETPLDRFDHHFALYQQPVVNPCNQIWLDKIYDHVRDRGVNVLLTGMFGNATISYRDLISLQDTALRGHWIALARDAAALIADRRASMRVILARLFGPLVPGPLWRRLLPYLLREFRVPVELTAMHPSLTPLFAAARRDSTCEYWHGRNGDRGQRCAILTSVDTGPYQKGVLAEWGIDQRAPTADRRVIETCLAMPGREVLRGGISLHERAFGRLLPPALLAERRRGLQAADWHEALVRGRSKLRTALADFDTDPVLGRTLDLPRLHRLVENLPETDWNNPATVSEFRYALLRAMALGHFVRKVHGGRPLAQRGISTV